MNRVLISFGSINIYWYSFLIVIAVVIGIFLSTKEAEKTGLGKAFLIDLIFFLIPIAIIGARCYYVIFNYDSFKGDFLSIFKVWEGGVAIYGAIIFSIIFIIYYCLKKEKKILLTLDVLAPSLILGQAIGRWGNFINQEAYGPATTLAFLQKLHLPQFIIEGMHINGIYYQPTFLYESLWCLLGFIILIIIRNKFKYKRVGLITFSYFIFYGIGRLFIEKLRTDSLYFMNFKVSQLVSIILILVGILGIIVVLFKNEKEKEVGANVKF